MPAPAPPATLGRLIARAAAGSWAPTDRASSCRRASDLEAGDPAAGDAEVLALILDALGGAPLDLVTGDMGLVLAAIDALETTDARKAALRRHVWRPARFHALLHRFGDGHAAARASREQLLLSEARGEIPRLVAGAGAGIGLRAAEEVEARVARLAHEAATPPLDAGQVAGIEAGSRSQGRPPKRSTRSPGWRAVSAGSAPRCSVTPPDWMPSPGRRRPESLPFEASFGRTTLEYYDGFVSEPCHAVAATCRRSPAEAVTTR